MVFLGNDTWKKISEVWKINIQNWENKQRRIQWWGRKNFFSPLGGPKWPLKWPKTVFSKKTTFSHPLIFLKPPLTHSTGQILRAYYKNLKKLGTHNGWPPGGSKHCDTINWWRHNNTKMAICARNIPRNISFMLFSCSTMKITP